MKKNLLMVIAAGAALVFSSCSDFLNTKSEGQPRIPGIEIVDAKGNTLSSVSGNYGEYYVKVTSDGSWSLSTPNNYVILGKVSGKGDAMVPFSVNNNWVDERTITIDAAMSDYMTRAGSDVSTVATQSASYSLSDVVKRVSSNLGTGYTLIPRADGNVAMSTGIQLFNISVMDSITKNTKYNLFVDDSYEYLSQYILSSSSNEALHKGVSVGVAGSLEVGGLTGSGNVNVGVGIDSTSNNMHAVMRMLRNTFTREMDYASAIALDSKYDILTPGFRMIRNNFLKVMEPLVETTSISKADSVQADLYCAQFCASYGTTFVSKAMIGCSFDYYISVDKKSLSDSITVDVVLKAKYADMVKTDSTATSTTTSNDSTKIDSIKVDGNIDVKYNQALNNAKNHTTAQLMIYGGNTKSVDILATGGSLEVSQLTKWRGTVTPENSVMTDVTAVPVSALFEDKPKIQAYLFDFIKRNATTDIKLNK